MFQTSVDKPIYDVLNNEWRNFSKFFQRPITSVVQKRLIEV